MKRFAIFVPFAAALACADAAQATTTVTSTLTVTATVLSACTVQPAVLSFGNYDPTSATDTTAQTTITFTCTPNTSYTVTLDAGANSADLTTTRNMKNGGNLLQYQLYTDSGRTTYWGNTAGHQSSGTTPASSILNTLTVYGTVPRNQSVPAGVAYTDTVNISLIY